MPLTPQELFAKLAALGISHETVEHPAVFTVEESKRLRGELPGAHVKNLFVKDKKSRLFLISAVEDTRIDLKKVHELIGGSGRVSFGSGELLREVLGVEAGSVTPLAAINDTTGRVTVVLDELLMDYDRINIHPLVNTMTTGLQRDDLVRFLVSTGHQPQIVALAESTDSLAHDTVTIAE
jgi:Ala-tRNA(Pro) deacylase